MINFWVSKLIYLTILGGRSHATKVAKSHLTETSWGLTEEGTKYRKQYVAWIKWLHRRFSLQRDTYDAVKIIQSNYGESIRLVPHTKLTLTFMANRIISAEIMSEVIITSLVNINKSVAK